MDDHSTEIEEQMDENVNAYAALILMVNAYWRMFMAESERAAVESLPEERTVRMTVTAEQLQQMGFDESIEQLHEMFTAVQERWDDDFDGILPMAVRLASPDTMALDIESEVLRAIIREDDEEMDKK